jgi:hypothetical protein
LSEDYLKIDLSCKDTDTNLRCPKNISRTLAYHKKRLNGDP